MAQVYKFRIELKDISVPIWRDIEISSLASVAKLGYAVIAAFEAAASHLFYIKNKQKAYEVFHPAVERNAKTKNATKTKLIQLALSIGDVLEMAYDYGAGWEFTMELVEITEMRKGNGGHYPYITDGQGKGIIEDFFVPQLEELIIQTQQTGVIPTVYSSQYERELLWDYTDFDVEFWNVIFKSNIMWIQDAYESN